MVSFRLLAVLLPAILVVPTVAAADSPAAPTNVRAGGVSGGAFVVTWTPGGATVLYNVYGTSSDGTQHLLITTAATSAPVVGAYTSIAVSAVDPTTNAESAPTPAVMFPCFWISFTPPSVRFC